MELNELLKGSVPAGVLAELPGVMSKFQITNPTRLAHFLGQCSHESGGFKTTSENLKYSAKRLKEVFGKYFLQEGLAEQYAMKPEKIGSRVYGGRMGNGNESTGEGYKFRGRGYIQITGKSNYIELDKVLDEDIVANPDLIATKYPLMSAGWFFDTHRVWPLCDEGLSETAIRKVTIKINGGTNGFDDRKQQTLKFAKLLGL